MQQDTLFVSATEVPSTVPALPSVDIYGPVHRGLRWALTSLLTQMGTTDFADGAQAAETLDDLEGVLYLCASHLAHENRHIHPAIARRRPELAARLDAEHVEHERAIDGLRKASARVAAASPADVVALGRALYLLYATFVGENLVHMTEEETVVQPLLDASYDPAELHALEAQIVGSIGPEEMAAFTKVMVPGNGRDFRVAMLSGAKAAMPPEAFRALLRACRPNLSEADWIDLTTRLEVAV